MEAPSGPFYPWHQLRSERPNMTDKIVWENKYLIGVKAVDLQHEYFADLINRLGKVLVSTTDTPYRQRLLDELFKYALFHFRSEENLMYAAGYPGLEDHANEHRALIDRLNAEARCQDVEVCADVVIDFLVDWFMKHTAGLDRGFGEFMRNAD